MAEIQLSETETPANLKDQLDKLSIATCTAGDRVTFLARTAFEAIGDAQSGGEINDAQCDALMRGMICVDMIADIGEEVSALAERLELLSMEQPAQREETTAATSTHSSLNDGALRLAWDRWRASRQKCNRRSAYGPNEADVMEWDAAELDIQGYTATTLDGLKIQLLVALSTRTTDREIADLACAENLDGLLAMQRDLDPGEAFIISALRSLDHMETRHG
mgnify:CR=1 FL=1